MSDQVPYGGFEASEFAENPEPRVACVLLLDVSGSMAEVVANSGHETGQTVHQDGQTYRVVSGGTSRIDLLNEGLATLKGDLAADTLASKRAEIAVITFGGRVEVVQGFVAAEHFFAPTLEARGDTPMGAAIEAAIDQVAARKDVYKANGISYYRPWIFLITDGGPTDHWQAAADRVRQGEADKAFVFFAVGVEGANMERLRAISVREPQKLKGLRFRELFQWLSASMQSVSRSSPGDKLALPAPSGWAEI